VGCATAEAARWVVAVGWAVLGVACAAGAEPAAADRQKKPKAARQEPALPDTSDPARGLDVSGLDLRLLYEADFSKPLRFVKEDDLVRDGRRVRRPEDVDWVLEGKASARVEGGRLYLTNDAGHLVFWNTRTFPDSFLLEFGVSPADANNGLNIVFFAATGRDGGDIFELDQPFRGGEFKTYHSGQLNCYHASYWAVDPRGNLRGTAHVRKNFGFHLVAAGKDFMAGQGPGPHRVRVLKLGARIQAEVAGKLAVQWSDDGRTYGPVLHQGRIGLRQMSHSKECSYTGFKVWAAGPGT